MAKKYVPKPKRQIIVFKHPGIVGEGKTRLAESAQCIYLAIAQTYGHCEVNDLSVKLLNESTYATEFFDIDTTVTEIWENLADSWLESASAIANHLIKKLKHQNYVFHRGSPLVKQIESKFYELNRRLEVPFKNINKWNVADIWLVRKSFNIELDQLESIDDLNIYLRDTIDAGNVIPVSIKLVNRYKPSITTHNTNEALLNKEHQTVRIQYVTETINTGKKNWLSSKSSIIRFLCNGQKAVLTIRNHQKGRLFNVEASYTAANHNLGKIVKDTASAIIDKYSPVPLQSYSIAEISKRSVELDFGLMKQVYQLANSLNPGHGVSFQAFEAYVKARKEDGDGDWLSSKFQSMLFLMSFRAIPDHLKNQAISEIYAAARAQSDLSGPYLEIK